MYSKTQVSRKLDSRRNFTPSPPTVQPGVELLRYRSSTRGLVRNPVTAFKSKERSLRTSSWMISCSYIEVMTSVKYEYDTRHRALTRSMTSPSVLFLLLIYDREDNSIGLCSPGLSRWRSGQLSNISLVASQLSESVPSLSWTSFSARIAGDTSRRSALPMHIVLGVDGIPYLRAVQTRTSPTALFPKLT
jgi:hypothetical protein